MGIRIDQIQVNDFQNYWLKSGGAADFGSNLPHELKPTTLRGNSKR